MIDPGKVHGRKLKDLFGELLERKTIFSMHLEGTGFERLTCITGLIEEQKTSYMYIDLPDGFMDAAVKLDPLTLRFNFNGPDHLEYLFKTIGGIHEGNLLKIPFPEFVDRLQRRRDFRVNAPPGARVLFKVKQFQGVIGMINISLGGVYGILLRHNLEEIKKVVLRQDQRVLNLVLVFPAEEDEQEQVILVRRAEVRRVEHDRERKLYKYAFEFTGLDKEEHKKLTQVIYHMQRQQLQRR